MTTSVRLDPASERLLARLAATRGATKSAIMREALAGLAARPVARTNLYDLMRDGIGVVAGDGTPRSEQTGRRVREQLLERHARRSR